MRPMNLQINWYLVKTFILLITQVKSSSTNFQSTLILHSRMIKSLFWTISLDLQETKFMNVKISSTPYSLTEFSTWSSMGKTKKVSSTSTTPSRSWATWFSQTCIDTNWQILNISPESLRKWTRSRRQKRLLTWEYSKSCLGWWHWYRSIRICLTMS